MNFDGAKIDVNDLVHDVLWGSGTVEQIIEAEDKMIVNFGGSRRHWYNSSGVSHFPMRTLYWRDPIGGFIPTKDTAKWTVFCELRKAVAQAVFASSNIK